MGSPNEARNEDNAPPSYPIHPRPSMPPPPYFKTHFINPSSFKSAVNAKLDKPAASLFRLSIRLLQFAFALASGISYAIELSHASDISETNFIYTQVVFGLTVLTLIVDSVTVRYYRFTWVIEWTLVILWITCFGVFYQVYMRAEIEEGYRNVDLGRMKNAVWCDLVNALLWMGSALFSSVMCCSGVKAAIKSKWEKRRQKKQGVKKEMEMEEMETGTVGARQ